MKKFILKSVDTTLTFIYTLPYNMKINGYEKLAARKIKAVCDLLQNGDLIIQYFLVIKDVELETIPIYEFDSGTLVNIKNIPFRVLEETIKERIEENLLNNARLVTATCQLSSSYSYAFADDLYERTQMQIDFNSNFKFNELGKMNINLSLNDELITFFSADNSEDMFTNFSTLGQKYELLLAQICDYMDENSDNKNINKL